MPRYTLGRWTLAVADDGTVQVLESGVLREELAPATFEARGETRPAYVPTNQVATFVLLVRRALHLLADRRLGPRVFVG